MITEVDDLEGVRFGRVDMSYIRYGDDIGLFADAEEKLQNSMSASNRTCVEIWMEVYVGPGKKKIVELTKKKWGIDCKYYDAWKDRMTGWEIQVFSKFIWLKWGIKIVMSKMIRMTMSSFIKLKKC